MQFVVLNIVVLVVLVFLVFWFLVFDHLPPKIQPYGSCIAAAVVGMRPTSRGCITISSIDPTAPPVIDPDFYSMEVNRAAMRAGVRQVMRLFLDTPEGLDMAETELPPYVFAKLTAQSSDEEIDERVGRVGATLFHSAGSAAMGKVVDTELKVMGVKGLKVVDASVIPVSICAHLQLRYIR
jgi:choline dehydrogenase-like flavoprotein